MTNRDMEEVGARLEEAFAENVRPDMTRQEQYELYELIAIQILDSEFMNYPEGELEYHLTKYLQDKRNRLLRF